MTKIIAFVVGTVVVLAVAIGYQVTGTSGGDGDKRESPPAAVSTVDPSASPAPSDSGTDGAKPGDEDRPGATEDHAGKPGENKG